MMAEIQVAPPTTDLFYVGIDGTDVVDTLAWGALWRKRFGWNNLLLTLDPDPKHSNRRLDPAHPTLPLIRATRAHRGVSFSDTCIMPEGLDGSGHDVSWPGTTPQANLAQMNQQLTFTQTFVLNPRVDSAAKTLTDGAGDLIADVVFISSHGAQDGDMFGVRGYTQAGVDDIFSLIQAVALNRRFTGPKWVLLSNCNTLFQATHNDWLDLIADPAAPLRGITGFRDACPLADGSVDLFATMIDFMAQGRTIVESWQRALTGHGLEQNWIVLCHEEAAGDTIQDWNASTLPPITKFSPPAVSQFTSDDPSGRAVVHIDDPFGLGWSKDGTPITAANRLLPANKIKTGDKVAITIRPPAGAPSFEAGTRVALMLVYIRVDYNQIVDVTKMFIIDPATSSGIKQPVRTTTLNQFAFKKDAPDTWLMEIDGTPAAAVLSLTVGNLDLKGLGHHNVLLRLRGFMKVPSRPSVITFDFIRNGSIIAA
jgi:hypothetical protein